MQGPGPGSLHFFLQLRLAKIASRCRGPLSEAQCRRVFRFQNRSNYCADPHWPLFIVSPRLRCREKRVVATKCGGRTLSATVQQHVVTNNRDDSHGCAGPFLGRFAWQRTFQVNPSSCLRPSLRSLGRLALALRRAWCSQEQYWVALRAISLCFVFFCC